MSTLAWSHSHGGLNLTFYVSSPSYPPFIYPTKDNGTFAGLIPDLLNQVAKNEGVEVNYLLYNRFRAEESIYNGEIDATVLASEWATHPEKLIFSTPLLKINDYFYQAAPFVPDTQLDTLIHNKLICARRGFAYPKLDQLFEREMADRVDTSSEVTQFKMLVRNRCQFAISNDLIAQWLIKQYQWQDKIFQFPNPINEPIGYTIAFTPKWKNFASKFDEHVAKLKENGELTVLLEKHLNVPMHHVLMGAESP